MAGKRRGSGSGNGGGKGSGKPAAPRATFGSWVGSVAGRRDVSDILGDYRAEHGEHAARELAAKLGISTRQARRYLAGQVRRPPAERAERIRNTMPAGKRAAKELRDARMVSAGTPPVVTKSSGTAEGSRRIGVRAIDGTMRELLDQAADALEAGDTAEAERLISDALLSYGGRGTSASEHLMISDFDGIDLQ